MRRGIALLVAVLASGCGGGDERATPAPRDCVAAWNAPENPHRSSLPESMGVASLDETADGCSYVFHDWGRFVSFGGRWGAEGFDWAGATVRRGQLTRRLQRAALDSHTVLAGGRLRAITEASRGWGRNCRVVGRHEDRTYELCRAPFIERVWRVNGVFVSEAGGGRRLVRVEPPTLGPSRQPTVGHWEWAALSPDGGTLLAHWSAECEVPIAYLVSTAGGLPREALPGAHSSFALGWSGDKAVVARRGSCGERADARLELVGETGVQATRITISHRILWEFRELVDAAEGKLGAVLRRCGVGLEARRPQAIRLAACR